MNKIYFVFIYCFILLNQFHCNLIFNVTENQRKQINGLNAFIILGILHHNKSILSEIALISLNEGGSRHGIISSHDYIPLNTNLLEIDRSSGDLVLKTTVDRESVCNYQNRNADCDIPYILTYKDKMKDFSLRIIDVNDNKPVFREKLFTLKLTEGKATKNSPGKLELPRAKDLDSRRFGLEKYTVSFDNNYDKDPKRKFEQYLKLENGKNDAREVIPYLKIIKTLDRESVDRFEFTLVAWDYDKKRGECRVTLTVRDINDNAPVWVWDNVDSSQSPPSVIEVSECSNTPAKELLRLHATDADDPNTINGQIKYSVASVEMRAGGSMDGIMDLPGLFYIPGDQILYVDMTRLTGMGSRTLTVKLRASDGGDLFTEQSIDVKILDCNDNRPIINVKHRTPKIVENQLKEVKLTTIVVKDSDRGQNADFECSINDTYRFQLRYRTKKNLYTHRLVIYDLSTVGGIKFDREQSPSIVLMINCEDKGRPISLSSSQMITVQLKDVNDRVPTFKRDSFTFRIQENIAIGTKLVDVRAIDEDSGDNGRVSYSLVDSNHSVNPNSNSNSFSINSRGEIQNSIEIDREKVSRYTLIVTATDHGKPKPLSSSCTVSLIVEDKNDWAPEVDSEYRFDVLEAYGSKTIHQVVGKIKATDKDIGKNSELRFSIPRRNSKILNGKYIQISNDGQISIFGKVDREKTPTIKTEVVIRDLGKPSLSSRTTIVINVLDVNDNKPTFVFPNLKTSKNYVNISFDAPAGTTIATIIATDPDNEQNGTVKYSLVGQPKQNGLFELHVTGQLVLTCSPSTFTATNKENSSKRSSTKIRHLPDRLIIQAEDSATKNPQKEITTLFLRYFQETGLNSKTNNKNGENRGDNNDYNQRRKGNKVRKDALYKYKNRNNNNEYNNMNNRERNRRNPNNKNGGGNSTTSTNMALLYGLAVVLFVVFIAVLFLLVFVFFKSRHSNHTLNNRNTGHNNNQSGIIGDYKAVIDTSQRNYHNKKSMNSHHTSLAGSNTRCNTGLLKQNPNVHTMGIRKSVDDLLAANFYDLSNNQTMLNPKDNYNQLLWMPSEPHYNLLYPPQNSPLTTTLLQHPDHQTTNKPLSQPLNNIIPAQSIPEMTLNNLKQDHHDQLSNNNNNSSSDKIDSLPPHHLSCNIITPNTTHNNASNANNTSCSGNTSTSKQNAYVTSTFV